MGGVDQRLFDLSTAAPSEKIQESNPHGDSGSVWQPHPENKVTGIAKEKNSKATTKALVHGISGINTTAVCLLKDSKCLSFEQKRKTTLFRSSNFLSGTQQASNTNVYKYTHMGDLPIFNMTNFQTINMEVATSYLAPNRPQIQMCTNILKWVTFLFLYKHQQVLKKKHFCLALQQDLTVTVEFLS